MLASVESCRGRGGVNFLFDRYGPRSVLRLIHDWVKRIWREPTGSKPAAEPAVRILLMAPVPTAAMDAYIILGISRADAADEAVVREAWRRRALEAHPDKGGSEEAFLEVQTAYEMLRTSSQGMKAGTARNGRSSSGGDGSGSDPWQARPPQKEAQFAHSQTHSAGAAPTPTMYYSTRTRWHMQFHCDRSCHGLRNAVRIFEDRERPRDLEPCPTCVPKRWATKS